MHKKFIREQEKGEEMKCFEEQIKNYMEQHGISQKFICDRTGISPPKLSMALNGKRRLSLEEYALICGALEVNTDKFVKPMKLKKTKNC